MIGTWRRLTGRNVSHRIDSETHNGGVQTFGLACGITIERHELTAVRRDTQRCGTCARIAGLPPKPEAPVIVTDGAVRSTTSLMREALLATDGEIARAIGYVEEHFVGKRGNAQAAIRTLRMKQRRHPRAARFEMGPSMFIEPAAGVAR